MSGTDGVSSRFDNAKKAAAQVIESLPSGSAVSVLLASDVVDAVIPEPTYDLNLARKTIEDATLTDRSTNLLPTFHAAFDILKKKASGHKELYLITDHTRGGWAQLPDIRKALDDTHDDVDTRLILVSPDVKQNLGVSDLKTAGDLAAVDRPQRFETTITNFGTEDAQQVRVQLRIDAESQASQKSIAGQG